MVTLLPFPEYAAFSHLDPHPVVSADLAVCWGVLYEIADSDIPSVSSHLAHREKDGYSTFTTTVYTPDGGPISSDVTIYVANSKNQSFLGPADLDAIAAQIAHTRGPSGLNREYLLGLHHALELICPKGQEDAHIVNLVALVRLQINDMQEEDAKLRDAVTRSLSSLLQ